MNEVEIKRHSFDSAKERLKEFSDEIESEIHINKVETDGGFLWLGNHRVTGTELNNRLEIIQDRFIAANKIDNKIIQEFRTVYNTFDALDKGYIKVMMDNLKSINKTSDDVRKQQETLKQHNNKLEKQQVELNQHQTEIEKNLNNISKIIQVLKKFKEKLESCKHLNDVDRMWDEYKKIQNEIKILSEDLYERLQLNEDLLNEEMKKTAYLAEQLKNVAKIKNDDSMHTSNTVIEAFKKKVKYAYLIAGGLAGISIIEMIVLLVKVI